MAFELGDKNLKPTFYVNWHNECGGVTLAILVEDKEGYVDDTVYIALLTVREPYTREYVYEEFNTSYSSCPITDKDDFNFDGFEEIHEIEFKQLMKCL